MRTESSFMLRKKNSFKLTDERYRKNREVLKTFYVVCTFTKEYPLHYYNINLFYLCFYYLLC
jgi:hypothetical protein